MIRMMTTLFVAGCLFTLAGCSGAAEQAEQAEGETLGTITEALPIGPGASFKKQGDLEADGWTCKPLAGTTVTFCTKPGTPGSWSCDPSGRCISNKTSPPKPPRVFGPIGGGGVIGTAIAP